VPRSISSFPSGKSRGLRTKGNYYIKLRNASIKTRATICTSQKISEKSHPSTQLRQIDLIMGDIPTKLLSPKEVTCEIKLASFLSHDDALSLNQTCKLFCECVPHRCLPPSTHVIKVGDRSLENGKLILSDVIMLSRIPLKDSTWIDLIQRCCPNLKHLFIIYDCKRVCRPYLRLGRFLCVEISMKIKVLNRDCLSIHLPSTVKIFTAYIKTFETILGEHRGVMDIRADTLDNLKSL
jgi:hypothetical protein